MLEELHVRELGVISQLTLAFEAGMTVLTGETGAGKTLVVTAIELLVGGRAEPMLVRPGAEEARVDGRFSTERGDEIVLSRVVPRSGRSRGYIDGRPASVNELAEVGRQLVDLHGQHAHQSLLQPAAQRRALDRFAGVDTTALREAAAELRRLVAERTGLGGDASARARELEFLRFQRGEIEAAALGDPDEDTALEATEDLLADAQAHQEAAAAAHEALSGEGGAADGVAAAIAAVRGRAPLHDLEDRARSLAAEVADLAGEARSRAEAIEPDPERLEQVRSRRQQLRDLHRKYGRTGGVEGGLVSDVLATYAELGQRLAELEGHGERAEALGALIAQAEERLRAEAARVGRARREAAPRLADAIQANLAGLAMAGARVEVAVEGDDPGDEVTFLLAANRGSPLLPLAKVASGGELARAMLALRLALHDAAPATGEPEGDGLAPVTMIFDEVDAGIGGAAATAVGSALARLARDRQVLVVTHLAQVAAWADAQMAVAKSQDSPAGTVSAARRIDGEERLVELARMLSGSPDSATARQHAAELVAQAAGSRRGAASGIDRLSELRG